MPIRDNETRTIRVKFVIKHGITPMILYDEIGLLNIGRFRINVIKKLLRIRIPRSLKVISAPNYHLRVSGDEKIIEISEFENDVVVKVSPFIVDYSYLAICILIPILTIFQIPKLEIFSWFITKEIL